MNLRTSLVRPVASLGAAALIFAACQTTLSLDNVRLQQVITQGLQDQAAVGATVSCPDNRPLKQGDTFECTAVTTDGANLTITVVQTDDAGNVNWNVTGTS